MEQFSPYDDGLVRRAALRYSIAFFTVAATYALKLAIGLDHASDAPFMLFLGAAFLSSFLGGVGAGLFAVVLGAVVAHLSLNATFIVRPPEEAHLELVRTLLFLVEGIVVSVLGGAAHGMRARMQRSAIDATFHQNVLRRRVQARDTAIAQERSARAEAEDALALLKATYDTAPIGLCVLDPDLRFRFINERLAEINGVPVKDHIGRTVWEVLPDLGPKTEAPFRHVLETGEPILDYELVGETPGQPGVARIWIENWFPLKDAAGRVTAINVVCEEVTEQRAAKEALKQTEARFKELADHIEDVFWIADAAQERILYVSPAYEQVWGRRASECYDDPDAWLEAVHPEDRDRVRAAYYSGLKHGSYEEEFRIVKPDGCVRWVRDRGYVIRGDDAEVVRFAGVATDITERHETEAALAESERRYRELLEALPLHVWTCAPDGTCDYLSPQWRAYTGKFGPEQLGRGWLECVYPDDRKRVGRRWQEHVASGGDVFECDFRIRNAQGEYRWFTTRAVPMCDAEGRNVRWFGTNTDVDDLKMAEQALRHSEAEYRASFALSAVGQGHADPETGRLLRVNEQLCAITGYSQEELLGLSFYEITHPEDREYDRDTFRAMVQGELPKYVAEKRYVRKDGSVAWVHVESILLRDDTGRPKHTVGVVMDITARKQAEDALNDAGRRKDEFLAMLAHELRNPLAPMRNALELMRLVEPAEIRLAHAQEIIDRQLSHLTRLVDDLLDVSRITRGKIQLQKKRLILQQVIDTVVDAAHPLMEAKEQVLEVDVPPEPISLEADEARMNQVIGNLLTNASKFTPHEGRISIMVGRVGDRAVIRVKDTGLGIPTEAQARIFDLFAQEERTLDRSQGGLGIGLTLVKELVERHGGTVEVKSEGRGRGSEFIVALPALPRAVVFGADDSEPAPNERRQGPLRVLVVEDNKDAADSFRLLLEISGHEVRLAYDGKEGVKFAEEFHPDIAFLDIGLPELDGFEVARRIRQMPALKRTVLVALSGYGREEDKEKAREAGFDEHMTKPVEYKKIAAFLTAVSGAIVSPESSTALH